MLLFTWLLLFCPFRPENGGVLIVFHRFKLLPTRVFSFINNWRATEQRVLFYNVPIYYYRTDKQTSGE